MVTSIYEALRQLGPGEGPAPGDQELLERYRRGGDDGAFAALLRRHGGMVWGVCRRLLTRRQDAEDAFQATFLVFARKAASIHHGHLLGSWLYGVACRTALRARRGAARWEARRAPLTDDPTAAPDAEVSDVPALIDEELSRLPEKYRLPVVLCCLEGMTREEAARSAGVPEGTLASRLARGRELLRQRLTRRGVACTSGPVAALLAGQAAPAATPPLLSAASPAALELTKGVLRAMWISRLKVAIVSLVAVLTLVGAGAVVLSAAADPDPQGGAQQPPRPGVLPPQAKGPAVVAAPVPFGRQWQSASPFGQKQPLRTVIRTEAEWRNLWTVLFSNAEDGKPIPGMPPLPKVDFTREMLLVACQGKQTSGGHAVTITRAFQTPEGLTAYIKETRPKAFTPVEAWLTYPFHVVAVPALRGDVTFLDEPEDTAPKGTPVAVSWTWDGQRASQQLQLRTAVRTQAEWQKLWRIAQGNAKPPKPAPKVDFSRTMILAIFMGERPCAGFKIQVARALKTDRGLTVYLRETEPPAAAFDKLEVTSPCHFALVPAVKGEVTFVDLGEADEVPAPGPDPRAPAPRAQAPKDVPVQQQWQGTQAKQEKPARSVVRTQKEWEKIWETAEGNVIPMPPAPKVDFSKQMVLAVFMGKCSSGGFSVRVTRVVRTEKGLTAHVRETVPGPGDIVTDVITSPYAFAVVPADKGPVTFENEPAAGK